MNAIFLSIDGDAYLSRFQSLPLPRQDIVLTQGDEEDFHYLQGVANQSYDYVLVSGSLVERSRTRSLVNWLRILKPNGHLFLENTPTNRRVLSDVMLAADALIETVQAWENHSTVVRKKAYVLPAMTVLEAALRAEHCGYLAEAASCYALACQTAPNELAVCQYAALFYERIGWQEEAARLWADTARQIPVPSVQMLHILSVLAAGDYVRGFKMREAHAETFLSPSRRSHVCPPPPPEWHDKRWQGQSLRGKTLAVWSEFGLGDEIMFARLAKMLKQDYGVGKLIWLVQPPIFRLMQSHPDIDVVLNAADCGLPEADYWVFPHAVLAYVDKPFSEQPVSMPYLFADGAAVLPASGKRRIGLVWRGSPSHENDRFRSLHDVGQLDVLLDMPDTEFFCLQKDLNDAERAWLKRHGIRSFADELHDFTDTAARLRQMDCLLTVDTSVVHVAGAMGVPAVLMLPFVYDWRWGVPGMQNLWYPSVQTVRQHSPLGGWPELLAAAKEKLLELSR
ncbi:MAG: hypothetical protein Q4E77_00315 [Conchiformibius sp.]|nr:hypothetical protein [Conchiformibius sp.]